MDDRLLHAKAAIVPSDDFQARTLARLQRQAVRLRNRRRVLHIAYGAVAIAACVFGVRMALPAVQPSTYTPSLLADALLPPSVPSVQTPAVLSLAQTEQTLYFVDPLRRGLYRQNLATGQLSRLHEQSGTLIQQGDAVYFSTTTSGWTAVYQVQGDALLLQAQLPEQASFIGLLDGRTLWRDPDALYATDISSGTQTCLAALSTSYTHAVLLDTNIYLSGDSLLCVDARTGRAHTLLQGMMSVSSPVLCQGNLYCIVWENESAAKQLWRINPQTGDAAVSLSSDTGVPLSLCASAEQLFLTVTQNTSAALVSYTPASQRTQVLAVLDEAPTQLLCYPDELVYFLPGGTVRGLYRFSLADATVQSLCPLSLPRGGCTDTRR